MQRTPISTCPPRLRAVTLLLAGTLGLSWLPAAAQDTNVDELRRDVQSLKQGQAEIRKQLQELKALLQARPAPAQARRAQTGDLENVTLDVSDDPVKGSDDARLVMMEFSDYECPYCARHTSKVLPELEREYVQAGKLRYVFRDFPLERIHRQAFQAARAANCAAEQGMYWQMHDRLFAHRKAIEPLAGHARAIGVPDPAAFDDCLASQRYRDEVRADMREGRKIGVSSTPTFVLGYTLPGEPGKVRGMRIVRGALPFARFKQEIDRLLADL